MSTEWVEIGGWRGLRLAQGRVSLVIAPEIGGRVISLCLDGVEVMFTHEEVRGKVIDPRKFDNVRQAKADLGWLHYGGYKTWLAPQRHWTEGLPFLDLDSGSYAVDRRESPDGEAVRLTSPVCRETGMQLTREISLLPTGGVRVKQGMVNLSDKPVNWGLWDVTQVAGPGLAVLPVADSSKFERGVLAYANEGRSPEIMDQFVEPGPGYVIVRCNQTESFKYGTDSRAGWILGLLDRGQDRWLAYLKTFPCLPGAPYPHQADVEVYDSDTLPYFELEGHSPMCELSPGESVEFSGTWVLDWIAKTSDPIAWTGWVASARAKVDGS